MYNMAKQEIRTETLDKSEESVELDVGLPLLKPVAILGIKRPDAQADGARDWVRLHAVGMGLDQIAELSIA
jgi:hypothetical protein